MTKPTYDLKIFLADCSIGVTKAWVSRGAMETARKDFGFKTTESVVDFIGTGGLEKPDFIKTKPWENNPNPTTIIMVDSWAFFAGSSYGYIAFLFHVNKWLIKSFKKNTQPDPRNLALKDKLNKILNLH